MDDLLTPLKTVKLSHSSPIETLSLKENHATHRDQLNGYADEGRSPRDGSLSSGDILVESSGNTHPQSASHKRHKRYDSTAFLSQSYLQKDASDSLPDDAREILRSQPDYEDLAAVLQYLQYGIERHHDFNIRSNNAKASQVIHVLVTTTLQDHWPALSAAKISKDSQRVKTMLISCLTSVAGIGALLSQIKMISTITPSTGNPSLLRSTLGALSYLLGPLDIISRLLHDARVFNRNSSLQRVTWQELTSFLGGSKVLATVAQAQPRMTGEETGKNEGNWLGDGLRYSKWLAKRIAFTATDLTAKDAESFKMLTQLLKRGLSLGYRDEFVAELYSTLLLEKKALWTPLHLLLGQLTPLDQSAVFNSMLRDLARKYLNKSPQLGGLLQSGVENGKAISGVAAMVKGIVAGNVHLKNQLNVWLSSTSGEHALLGLDMRRAVIATLALNEETLQLILNKSLENFGDKTNIEYAPVLQQEALAQIILLVAGYLSRLNVKALRDLSRSSIFMTAVSNRLGASLLRARLIGMAVGVAISRIVDDPNKAINFGVQEMESQEAQEWLKIIFINDPIGALEDLQSSPDVTIALQASSKTQNRHKPAIPKPPPKTLSRIIKVEELEDTDDEEDLPAYQKPDDDPYDSEEDPTLIDRAKPAAPVYIRDLIRGLQTSDKPDLVYLALETAPSLIRRKANFGTELTDNIYDLAAALINLQDGMFKDEAHSLRLEGLIASLVASPEKIGPWLSSMYFEGDLSLAQRASLLSAVGLGARELSGFKDDPKLVTDERFPSKRLPQNLDAIYAPINAVAKQIEHATLQPMALEAADKLSGPDALKVRTFSSRMEVEKRIAQKTKDRQIRIPKNLHKLLSESFYLPFCYKMTLLLSTSMSNRNSSLFEPHTMKLFIQTLTIIITCLGPHSTQLPAVTRETLNFLVALHSLTSIVLNSMVLPPSLQLLLTTMDLNIQSGPVAEEHLVTDFGNMVAELVTWASGIGESVSIPVEAADGMPWNVLAAGCQVKWQEVGRKFQGRMMGLSSSDYDTF